jgi:endonuclease/exonuclease/phosphatase family metal-dependent hydrolase
MAESASKSMKCVTYNIQYGIGLDGKYDLGRIVDALRGADIIALQEVTRGNPRNGGADMVADICSAFPDYFPVIGQNFEANFGSHLKHGKAVKVSFELNNMILSRTAPWLSRNVLLPGNRSYERMNFQRGALEALIETPLGAIRFYSTHLDHISPDERVEQIRFLKKLVLNYPHEGGALSGLGEVGLPEPPCPEHFVIMGDFNMLADSPEYIELCGRADHEFGKKLIASNAVDVAARLGVPTDEATSWVDPERPEDLSRHKRIDYVFTSASLAGRLKKLWVDHAAIGSDHQPVWVELG